MLQHCKNLIALMLLASAAFSQQPEYKTNALKEYTRTLGHSFYVWDDGGWVRVFLLDSVQLKLEGILRAKSKNVHPSPLASYPTLYPYNGRWRVQYPDGNTADIDSIPSSVAHASEADHATNADVATYALLAEEANSLVGYDGTTSTVTEGSNLYFTNARARSALGVVGSTPLKYNSLTGLFAIDSSVTSGTFTLATVTLDKFGRVTSASSATLPGSSGQFLYNNGGALGASSALTISGATVTAQNFVAANSAFLTDLNLDGFTYGTLVSESSGDVNRVAHAAARHIFFSTTTTTAPAYGEIAPVYGETDTTWTASNLLLTIGLPGGRMKYDPANKVWSVRDTTGGYETPFEVVGPGTDTANIAFSGYYPSIWFNLRTTGVNTYIRAKSGYSGNITFDPTSSTMYFRNTAASGAAGSTPTFQYFMAAYSDKNVSFPGQITAGGGVLFDLGNGLYSEQAEGVVYYATAWDPEDGDVNLIGFHSGEVDAATSYLSIPIGTPNTVLGLTAGKVLEYIATTGSNNLVRATSPTLVTPILGTPTSVTLTNATGLPISTGVSGLGTGVATFLATPSSANLRSAVTDESGTGALLFAGGALGAATATTINGNTFTTGTYTLTGSSGKTLTFSNSLTLAGTDGTTMTFPATSKTLASLDGSEAITNKTFGMFNYAADAQASDTYVITLSPAPAAYTTGMVIFFKANTANTGAASINVNSLGAKTIVKAQNTTLANNDILASMFCVLVYDGTNMVLMNPRAL